jgi:hypothetical protein
VSGRENRDREQDEFTRVFMNEVIRRNVGQTDAAGNAGTGRDQSKDQEANLDVSIRFHGPVGRSQYDRQ